MSEYRPLRDREGRPRPAVSGMARTHIPVSGLPPDAAVTVPEMPPSAWSVALMPGVVAPARTVTIVALARLAASGYHCGTRPSWLESQSAVVSKKTRYRPASRPGSA